MERIIQRILDGDEQAVIEFYQENSPKILKYLQKKLPSEDAHEICNDVFLEAIDSLSSVTSNHLNWLYGIAHHKMVDFYRKRKIKSILLSQMPFLELVAAEISQPEFQFEKNRIKERIETCLKALPFRYEQIIRLHYEEKQSIKDIGLVLNLSPKAAESLLYRARKEFMTTYERA